MFFGPFEKPKRLPLPLIGWQILTSPVKPPNRIQPNLKESKISMSSTKFVFFGPIGKKDDSPGLWLAEAFSTSPLNLLNRIQRNLTGSKISMSSTKFVFFGPIGKKKSSPMHLIGWDISHCSETVEWISTKLDRKQDLNVHYQKQDGRLASNWQRHFQLLLWNCWTEFKEPWQVASSLPSSCFSGQWVN